MNDRKNTLKQTKHKQNQNLFINKHMCHVTKAAGIEVFYDPHKMRALSSKQIV